RTLPHGIYFAVTYQGDSLTVATRLALSATLFWDPTHTQSTTGSGSGTWDTATANWWNGSADVAWSNASNDVAVFGGRYASFSVSLGTGITASSVNFTIGNYQVSGNTLTLAGGTGRI